MTTRRAHGTLALMNSSDLVLAMLRDSDAGDLDSFRARLTPDCEWINPMLTASSPDEIVAGIEGYRAAFPDYRHDVTLVFHQGSTVVLEGHWTGTNTGPLVMPDGELAPTGRSVRVPFAAVAGTRGDRIESVRVYLDPLGFMSQLGLVGEPAGVAS
jgi:ketosteroid isomerase-like protein